MTPTLPSPPLDTLDTLDALYTSLPNTSDWSVSPDRYGYMVTFIKADDAHIAQVSCVDWSKRQTAEEIAVISHATADWIIAIHSAYPAIASWLRTLETERDEARADVRRLEFELQTLLQQGRPYAAPDFEGDR